MFSLFRASVHLGPSSQRKSLWKWRACEIRHCMGNSCLFSVFSSFFQSHFYHFTQPTYTNSLLLYWCLQMVLSNLPPYQFVNYWHSPVIAHSNTWLGWAEGPREIAIAGGVGEAVSRHSQLSRRPSLTFSSDFKACWLAPCWREGHLASPKLGKFYCVQFCAPQ